MESSEKKTVKHLRMKEPNLKFLTWVLQNFPKSKILVHCKDGSTQNGLFLAKLNIALALKAKQSEISIMKIVRKLKDQEKELMSSEKDY